MAFFGKVSRQNRLNSASRDIAFRLPTSVGETVSTAFMESVGNSLSVSIATDREFSTRDLLDEAEKISGLSRRGLKNPSGADANPREQVAAFQKEYDKWRESNPDAPKYPATEEAIAASIRAKRQKRKDASDFARQGEQGFSSGAARFLGSTAGFLVDPINILSMGIAGLGRTVLGTAARQAGIGAGSEVLIQSLVQGQRPGIGEQPSAGEAFFAIGSAAVGAAALGGSVAAIGKGLKRLRTTRDLLDATRDLPPEFRTQEVRDAEAILTYLDSLERTSPFPDTPVGRSAHLQRLTQVFEAMKSGKSLDEAFDVPKFSDPEVRTKTVEADPLGSFTERLKKSDPELYKKIDDVHTEIKTILTQIDEINKALPEVDPKLVEKANETTALREELATAQRTGADRRKVKKLQGKVRQSSKADEGLERRVIEADKAFKKGVIKREKLQKKLDKFTKEQQKLLKKSAKTSSKIDPYLKNIEDNRKVLETAGLGNAVEDVNKLGQMIRALALSRVHKTVRSSPVGQASRILDDIIEEGDAGTKARVDTMEAQVRELADIDETTKFDIANEDGTVRQVTAREMLEDLKEDQKLVSEIEKCIAGALT